MIVDILRSCSVQQARLLAGSDATTPIRWYPAAPGARPLPIWTAYGSPVWEPDRELPPGARGVQYAPLEWRPNRYPAPPGQEYHGQPEWYVEGIPALGPPPAEGCVGPELPAAGGLLLGGTAPAAILRLDTSAALALSAASTLVETDVLASTAALSIEPATTLAYRLSVPTTACVCLTPQTVLLTPGTVTTRLPLGVVPVSTMGTEEGRVTQLPLGVAPVSTMGTEIGRVTLMAPGLTIASAIATNRITSSACLCFGASTTLRRGPIDRAEACLCLDAETTLVAYPVYASEACLCLSAATTLVVPSPPPPPCDQCDGPTPNAWTVAGSGWTGSCAAFEGTWVLRPVEPCHWQIVDGGVTVDLQIQDTGLTVEYWLDGGFPISTYGTIGWDGDCASPRVVVLMGSLGCPGSPGSVTITPSFP